MRTKLRLHLMIPVGLTAMAWPQADQLPNGRLLVVGSNAATDQYTGTEKRISLASSGKASVSRISNWIWGAAATPLNLGT
jgi:hypothetical protein